MAIEAFIKIGDYEGETADTEYPGYCDVLSWSFGIHRMVSMKGGTGNAEGTTPVGGEFVFSKFVEKASPDIFSSLTGTHIPEIVLEHRKGSGDNAVKFLTVTMKECYVTSWAPSAGGGSSMESVSIAYRTLHFKYYIQNNDGTSGGDKEYGWNFPEAQMELA